MCNKKDCEPCSSLDSGEKRQSRRISGVQSHLGSSPLAFAEGRFMTSGETRHAISVGVLGWTLGVLLVLSPLPASATVIFVKAEATGAGGGTR